MLVLGPLHVVVICDQKNATREHLLVGGGWWVPEDSPPPPAPNVGMRIGQVLCLKSQSGCVPFSVVHAHNTNKIGF